MKSVEVLLYDASLIITTHCQCNNRYLTRFIGQVEQLITDTRSFELALKSLPQRHRFDKAQKCQNIT